MPDMHTNTINQSINQSVNKVKPNQTNKQGQKNGSVGKALAAKLDDLSPMPRIHMMEGENHTCKLFSDLSIHILWHTHMNKKM